MIVFASKAFLRFARKEGLADRSLCLAVEAALQGRVDADLGGGVIKQRIARPGQGKSGGYRVIILLRIGSRALFVHGFGKRDKANITPAELDGFRELAAVLLALDESQMSALVAKGAFVEIRNGTDENLH